MLLSRHERPSVMDLDLTSVLPANSRKSSLSLIEKASLPDHHTHAHQRRLSASQIIPIVSQSLLLATANGFRRSPLAPLDPQLAAGLNTDIAMADGRDSPTGRKPSITLTNATRPTPYSQRSIPRRPLPSQQRRTSLPTLHLPADAPRVDTAPVDAVELSLPQEEDIYSRLSTFTFGDAPASSQHQAPLLTVSRSGDGSEGISPLQRLSSFDRTPRPSIAPAHSPSGTNVTPPVPSVPGQAHSRTHGWSSPSEDEDDVRRNTTRSKMRAIDDGTRRPSLPSNDGPQSDTHHLSGQVSSYTEKGKSKTTLNLDRERFQEGTRQGRKEGMQALSSPSSHTDGEGDLELTDVDLMAVDYPGRRRRREHDPAQSDRSSMHTFGGDADGRLSSDMSSVYGDDEDDREREGMDEDDDDDNRDPLRKDSARTWTENMGGGRRRSLPMAIPQPGSSHGQPQTNQDGYYPSPSQQRYDDTIQVDYDARAKALAQFRRPSRSMDDDSQRVALHLRRRASRVSVTAATTATVPIMGGASVGPVPSSEPDMRGVALANAMAQAQGEMMPPDASSSAISLNFPAGIPNDSPYEGLDLSYILSVSGPANGANTANRGSDAWSGRLSVGSSVAAREARERENSWAFGWGINAGGRRPSTATVNDDTFLRFVKNNDYTYDERRREWSFMREKAEGPGVVERPGEEIWRCVWVGRYKVERVKSKNNDPNKPPQMRLNVKHIPDPYSKGNKRGGPLTFIHKHSRAQAFSIFRGHQLPQRHLKTSSSILLAPKKVQEQFTSTRTTSKLSTHGLLEEKSPTAVSSGRGKSAETASGSSVASAAGSSKKSSNLSTRKEEQATTTQSLRERAERLEAMNDRKGKGVERAAVDMTPSTSQSTISSSTSTAGTSATKVIDIVEERLSKNPVARLRDSESRPTSSLADTASLTSDGSHVFSSAVSAWDQSSIGSSQRHSTRPTEQRRGTIMPRGSVASLEDQPVRTSHQEAFATLDPPFIEYLRMHSQNYEGLDHESHSRFKAIKKLFNSQANKNSPRAGALNAGSPVAVLEGHYTPPWLTMAARSKQEEQERVIKNLNDSFRDVGLLPSFKPNDRNKSRTNKKGKRGNETAFDQIPDDSLYMLLPMWPGETDHANSVYSDQEPDQDIPLEERQYLLVYYVPMLTKEKHEDKKRSRHSQTSSANSHHSDSSITKENKTNIALSAFNILARLVSYRDIYGSGIRIPTNGLSVTGPIMEAMHAIPHIRFLADDLSLIIGFCDKRERGVEILPEGCEKLGLCLPRTSPDPDSDAPLSSLGRAAVEMAWLGALAVMGFGNLTL